VVFDRIDALPRVPVQLFEAIAYVAIALLLWWQMRRHGALLARGRMTGLYFVLVFGARAVLEFWKLPQAAYESNAAFSVGQWLSVPFIALGLYLVWRSGQDDASAR
jgi:prolipoprotein diacylglyceryltransferase